MAESGMNYELFCIGFVLGSLYMDAKEDMINETNVLLREEKPNLKGSSNIIREKSMIVVHCFGTL